MRTLRPSLFSLSLLAALLAPDLPAQEPVRSGQQAKPEPALQIERELFQVGGESHALRFSPNGKWLASGGDRGDVVVLDVASGQIVHQLEASDHWVGGLRFSPSGDRLAVVGRSLTVWNLKTGKQLGGAGSASAQALDWSRDGKFLVVVTSNNEAALLDADDLSVVHTLPLAGPTAVDAVAIDATSSRVAVGKRSGDTFVFDAVTGALRETLKQPDWVHGLQFLDDGRLLRLGWKGTLRGFAEADLPIGATGYSFAAQSDGSRVLVRTAKDLVCFKPGKQPVRSEIQGPIALHPDGVHWAHASNGILGIHRGDKLVRTLGGAHREAPGDAVMTGDGRYAVVVGVKWREGTTQVFDVATGERLKVAGFPTKGELIANAQGTEVVVHVSADGKKGSEARELQFWSILPGKQPKAHLVRKVPFSMKVRTGNPDTPPSVLSADGRYFGHGDQLIDLEDATKSFRPNRILFSETHPVGRHYIISRMAMHSSFPGAGLGVLHAFSRDGAELHKLRLDSPPRAIAPSPDGQTVAVSLPAAVELLTVPELKNQNTLSFSFRDLIWVDDHHLLASGISDQLSLVDVRTGKVVQTLRLGSWARRIDYHANRGVALVTVQDRALIVRVQVPN
tara:strand:- start:11687 stop:13549 length:1863 start_codon:yes stop_codon:yes gene_type:complete